MISYRKKTYDLNNVQSSYSMVKIDVMLVLQNIDANIIAK